MRGARVALSVRNNIGSTNGSFVLVGIQSLGRRKTLHDPEVLSLPEVYPNADMAETVGRKRGPRLRCIGE